MKGFELRNPEPGPHGKAIVDSILRGEWKTGVPNSVVRGDVEIIVRYVGRGCEVFIDGSKVTRYADALAICSAVHTHCAKVSDGASDAALAKAAGTLPPEPRH